MKRNLIIIMCVVAAALSAAAGEVTFKASTDGFGPGQRIGARLLELLKPYSGTPDTTATVKILFDRAGTYYLDRSINVHCNLEMDAVKGAKFVIVNDFKYKDNSVIGVNVAQEFPLAVKIQNMDIEMEKHDDIAFGGKVGHMFKFYNCKSVDFRNCSIVLHNAKMTNLLIFGGRNITVRDNVFANYNNCLESGNLWIVGSCENVDIRNNRFEKYGNDEVIAFYEGNKSHMNVENYEQRVVRRNIVVEGNKLTYERPRWATADTIINCDIFISFYPQGIGHQEKYATTFSFENVRFASNDINIKAPVKRIFSFSTDKRVDYKGISFIDNRINIDTRLYDTERVMVFDIATVKQGEGIIIAGNKVEGKLLPAPGKKSCRCDFLYMENVNAQLISNEMTIRADNEVMSSNKDANANPQADYCKVKLRDNLFQNLSLLGAIGSRKGTTKQFKLEAQGNVFEGNTKLYSVDLARADIEYRGNTFNCTGYELLFQNFARQGTLTFTDNTVNFSGRTDYCLYANYEKTGNTDRFTTFDFSNNTIRGVQASKLRTDNIPVARRGARLAGNSFW